MDEVRKVYENLPPYEEVKIFIVRTTFRINQLQAKVQTFIMLERDDPITFYEFKSEVLNFYQYLRPKILTFDFRKTEEKDQMIEMCRMLDYYLYHPSDFPLEDAVTVYNNLLTYCEKDRLTSTRFYGGYGRDSGEGKSVYND